MDGKYKAQQLNELFLAMIRFDAGDPLRIQHFTKVHSYARLIAQTERLDPEEEFTLEAAAYVHDIGIHVAEQKYGHQNGKLQEQEGPAAARKLMEPLGFTEEEIQRVEYLVGHHHTYTNIDAPDYQILVEADFIVNLFEDNEEKETALAVRRNIFRTKTGTRILNDMFGLEEDKGQELHIRHSEVYDLPRIMEIYSYARKFMTEHGNPRQWGATGWPPEELIRKDIEAGKSYVCVSADKVIGTFYYDHGNDIEPTYRSVSDGSWRGDANYGVVHRMASDGSVKGVGSCCINWAFEQCHHLRVDTHPDNQVMQNLLTKLGFEKCGIIHVIEDDDPRFAYEKR